MEYDVYSHNRGYCSHKNDTETCFAMCKQCKEQDHFEPEHVCESCVHADQSDHGNVMACNCCCIGDKEDNLWLSDNYEHVPMPRITFSEACKLMCAMRKEAA